MSASISLSAQQGKGAVGGTWGFTLPSRRFLGRAQRQRVRAAAGQSGSAAPLAGSFSV